MFGPFERMVAGRYLRARKGERFVSIIAIFSLVGIALGVATLIVVTSVMSGFQTELVSRILGVNGHVTIEAYAGQKIDTYANTGALPERHRSGHPSMTPYEAFDAADGAFLICAGNDRLFGKLAEVMARPDWITDPRFASNRDRLKHKPALFAAMRPILATRTRADWVARMEAAGVPAAQIHSIPEALAQPQVQALGMFQAIPGEDFKLTAMPISFDGERPQIARAAPRLNEH